MGPRALVLVVPFLAASCDAGPPAKPATAASAPSVVPNPPPPPPPHVVLASLARGACYGACPVYSLVVYRDGAVEYEGTRFVKTVGKATGRVTPEQVAALDQLFTSHSYLTLEDTYTTYEVTDMPSASTSYHPARGAPKSIEHYYGDSHAPAGLTELEEDFDRIVKIETWIGTAKEREAR